MFEARAGFKQITCSIVVKRANGTVEDLGVVAYWHKNPFKRMWHKLNRLLRQ